MAKSTPVDSLRVNLPSCRSASWTISAMTFTRRSLIPNRLTSVSNVQSSPWRSEEHTSELQSRSDLVCRLLLEKKKTHRSRYRQHRVGHIQATARQGTQAF